MKTNTKKVVTFGEIMMRLSAGSHQRFNQAAQLNINYGGSEANVAVSLSHFGIFSEHVTCIPTNDFGWSVKAHLQAHGVSTRNIIAKGGRLGLYFLEEGLAHRSSKIIYDRFDSSFANLDPSQYNWEQILEGANWLHWSGITPAVSKQAADACFQAISAAHQLKINVSADINYRRNLWQYGKSPLEVMPNMINMSNVLIGGLVDFENCMGIQATDFESGCLKVQQKFPSISKIANTERISLSASHNKISALLWDGDGLHRSKEYELTQMVDRIGAGDAFVAGLLYGWLNEFSNADTLDFAIAACVLKHTVPGDVNTVSVKEVQDLVQEINVGKLLR